MSIYHNPKTRVKNVKSEQCYNSYNLETIDQSDCIDKYVHILPHIRLDRDICVICILNKFRWNRTNTTEVVIKKQKKNLNTVARRCT